MAMLVGLKEDKMLKHGFFLVCVDSLSVPSIAPRSVYASTTTGFLITYTVTLL